MLKENRCIFFILLLFSALDAHSQNIRWYCDKPNTSEDTLAILRNKVKSISECFGVPGDSCEQSNKKVIFHFSKNNIDSVTCCNMTLLNSTVKKGVGNSITEIIRFKNGASENDSITVYRRVHYFNKLGQISMTANKKIAGHSLEGESYSKITYEYEKGLLVELHIFDGSVKGANGENYFYKKYKYY